MRTITALLAGLAWALAACAPPPPAGEPALWRIADADSEIWLFGTVHILPPDLDWRGPRLEAAFAAADELVTETDTSDAAAAELAALAQRHGTLPPGEWLSAKLEPADRARLARVARDLGLDLDVLERMRPWLAGLQLSYAYAASQGHSAAAGVETLLVAEARASGKQLSFLETAEQQVRVLSDLPERDAVRFLSLTLGQIEAGGATLSALDRAWARGDVDTLERLLAAEWRIAGPAIHEAVILERNRAWADAIEARLDGSGRIFIAVGAAHLVGEDSVVDLLRERGIEVDGP